MKEPAWSGTLIKWALVVVFLTLGSVDVLSQEQRSQPTRTAIVQAQRDLAMLGYDAGPADGAPGSRTVAALKKFQADQKLTVTGILDANTIAFLHEAASRPKGKGDAIKSVDPKAAEDAEWKNATAKDTPAAYWEFNGKYPNSDRVRIVHGRIATTVAYINAGNGMEAHAYITVGSERFPITESEMQQWRFVRYEHAGNCLIPASGGAIADGTAILVREDEGRYRVVDVQGTVDGGGTDPFKPSLQLNGNAVSSGGLLWQLEASLKAMTWEDAKNYCIGLRLEGSGDGWRLPTQPELVALYSGKSSILKGNKEFGIITSLNAGRYWSSSPGAAGADYAQEVDFDSGATHDDAVGYRYLVRCVK